MALRSHQTVDFFMGYLLTVAKKAARRAVEFAGGVLLSKTIYQQILLQRKNATEILVEIEQKKLRSGLACLVFSKDRPMQLFTLLHTYFENARNPAPVTVIYDASNQEYANAYHEVEQLFSGASVSVRFVKERGSFRETLVRELDTIEVDALFFLVDDIIFIRPVDFSLVQKIDPRAMVLSLRHSPHLRYSYTGGANVLPPKFSSFPASPDLLTFKWFEGGYEWSDPWSVDGQVLSTAEVRVLTRISQFKAPNSYEVALKAFNGLAENRIGVCFKESKILNLPINRVQSEIPNLSGSISCAYLLAQWNLGMMIDTKMFANHAPISPHEEHVIKLARRP
jgi:hypothetical protein